MFISTNTLATVNLDDLYGDDADMARSDFCRAIATLAAWVDNHPINPDDVDYLAMALASLQAKLPE